jgi:hypothetical protein
MEMAVFMPLSMTGYDHLASAVTTGLADHAHRLSLDPRDHVEPGA